MRKNRRNAAERVAAALLFMVLLAAGAAGMKIFARADERPAAERRVVKVAFPVLDGFTYYDKYKNRCGLVVDYLNEISKYTNWEYEYVDVSYDKVVTNFMDGKYDLLGGNYYSPEMEQYFAYPDYSIGSGTAVLLRREGDESINNYDLRSLNGKTIGVYERAGEKIRLLKRFLEAKGIECTLKYYTYEQMDANQTLFTYLKNGEVDMLLGNESDKGEDMRVVTSFEAQPFYIVAQPGDQELLDGLNGALKHIMGSNPDFPKIAYENNFAGNSLVDIQFRPEEKAYIEEKGTVTVAVTREGHPFYCADSHNKYHEGIVKDILEQISSFSGLEFTYVPADTYAGAIKLVQDGKADILGSFMESDAAADGWGFVLTRSYTEINNIIVKNKAVDFPGTGLIGAAIEGRQISPELNPAEVKYYPTLLDGVRAVDRGDADFVYALSPALEEALQSHYFTHVTPLTLVNNNTFISFAMARPAEPLLLDILNKSIGNISDEEMTTIVNKNTASAGYTSLSPRELIYAYPFLFVALIGMFFAVIFAAYVLTLRAKMRSALMEEELKRAEAESRAKGDFLSRMSHEIRTPMNAIVGLTDLTCMMEHVPAQVKTNLDKIRLSSGYLLSLINDILDMSRIENNKMVIAAESFSMNALLSDLEAMMKVQAEQQKIHFVMRREVEHDWLTGDSIRLRQVLLNLLSNALKFTPAGGDVCLTAREAAFEGGLAKYCFSVRDTGIGIAPEYQDEIFEAFEQQGTNSAKSQGTGLGLPISRSIVRLMGGDIHIKSSPGEGAEFYFSISLAPGEQVRPPAKERRREDLAGVRALLVEDNDLNAEIAAALLELMEVFPERASNGQEAVDRFLAHDPGHYDVILMDIQMPVKNGLEAAREIRGSGRPDAETIPIIAMTANSFKEDVEAAREAGMTAFIPKPVDSALLFEIMRENIEV